MLSFTRRRVTELYFGETDRVVLQFLEHKKKVIRIMYGWGKRVLCRNLFQKLQILPFDITIAIIILNVCSLKKPLLNKH
jgi:hypothetical protein